MKPHERNTEITNYEDFLDAWDYVPMEVISDTFWVKNQDLIRSITFDLYRFEKQRGDLDLKSSAKRLEIIFSNLFKYDILK